MKKFLSLVLSLVMLVSMGTTAFAAEKAPISFEQYATDFESFLKSGPEHIVTQHYQIKYKHLFPNMENNMIHPN